MKRTLSVLIVVALAAAANAATLQQLSLDQMSQGATAVVRARVTGSYAAFTGNTIYTHYKLESVETWKGFPTAEVMVPGGQASGYRQTFPGVPELKTGSEYLLFLWTSSTGITHLMGLGQGLFDVRKDADGTLSAVRAQLGEMMLDSVGRKVADTAISIRLADFRSRVTQSTASVIGSKSAAGPAR